MKNSIKIDKSSKKILLIGANGFLGTNILSLRTRYQKDSANFKLIAGDIQNTHIPREISFYYIDITNAQDVMKKILIISPDVIILTSAMTDVDQNEVDKELATRINTEGPKNVLRACKHVSCLVWMF